MRGVSQNAPTPGDPAGEEECRLRRTVARPRRPADVRHRLGPTSARRRRRARQVRHQRGGLSRPAHPRGRAWARELDDCADPGRRRALRLSAKPSGANDARGARSRSPSGHWTAQSSPAGTTTCSTRPLLSWPGTSMRQSWKISRPLPRPATTCGEAAARASGQAIGACDIVDLKNLVWPRCC